VKLTLTPTEYTYLVNDTIPVRAWEGVTEHGVKCRVYIAAIQVDDGEDQSGFDAELRALDGVRVFEPFDPGRN